MCTYTYKDVYCSFVYKPIAKIWKQPKCPLMDEWIPNVVYSAILFSLKKEGNSDTCCNMGEPRGNYAKRNKPVTKGQILYVSTYLRCLE